MKTFVIFVKRTQRLFVAHAESLEVVIETLKKGGWLLETDSFEVSVIQPNNIREFSL